MEGEWVKLGASAVIAQHSSDPALYRLLFLGFWLALHGRAERLETWLKSILSQTMMVDLVTEECLDDFFEAFWHTSMVEPEA